MNWFIKCLRQYSDFKGRARRKEYWMFCLIYTIIFLVLIMLDLMLFILPNVDYDIESTGFPILSFLFCVSTMFPSMAVLVRRLHDIGKSGWLYFKFALIYGLLSCLSVFLLLYGEINSNDILQFSGYGVIAILTVAYIGFVILLARDSELGENKWGLNPKDPLTPEDDIVNVDCFKYYAKCWKHYFDFKGRARRSEFWMFIGVNCMIQYCLSVFNIIGNNINTTAQLVVAIIYILYSLAVFIPSVAVTVRRLHDIGESGWWFVIYILLAVVFAFILGVLSINPNTFFAKIVVIYAIILLITSLLLYAIMLKDSQPGDNQWGSNPKEIEE